MEATQIKNIIEKTLTLLLVNAHLDGITELEPHGITKYSIKTDDPFLLIGHDGTTLQALNHLIKKISERHNKDNKKEAKASFLVDVNDYQEKKIEDLKMKAQIMAERARFFRSNVELTPMNPYERMIIHSIFAESNDIETESTGIGRERRVIIRYVDQKII